MSAAVSVEIHGSPLAAVRDVLRDADDVLLGVAFVRRAGVNLVAPQLKACGGRGSSRRRCSARRPSTGCRRPVTRTSTCASSTRPAARGLRRATTGSLWEACRASRLAEHACSRVGALSTVASRQAGVERR